MTESLKEYMEKLSMGKFIHKNSDSIKTGVCLTCILVVIFLVSCHYLTRKSGYYVDEGMTLFLSNSQYNGAVTTQSEYGFGDFLSAFVLKDTIGDTVSNIYGMLQQVITAGDYSKEGTVEWYDAARRMLQGESVWVDGDALFNTVTVPKGEGFKYGQVYLNQVMDVHPPYII